MSKVIDFKQKKDENTEKRKQSIERLVLNDMIGCSTVIDNLGTNYPVKLIDISHDGCLLQVPERDKKSNFFEVGKELTLRFYFTESSYIPVTVTMKHEAEHDEAGKHYLRLGCEFDKSTTSFKAMEKFIEFLYQFAELSVIDKGDHKVYFL